MAIKKAVPAVYRTACLRYGVETRRYFPLGGSPLAQDFKETSYNITIAVCFINPFITFPATACPIVSKKGQSLNKNLCPEGVCKRKNKKIPTTCQAVVSIMQFPSQLKITCSHGYFCFFQFYGIKRLGPLFSQDSLNYQMNIEFSCL